MPQDTHNQLSESLPQHYYVDPYFFKLEQQKIFATEWICVGRSSDLPVTGSYQVHTVANESILLVREGEQDIHAFYNVCRHRGSQLVPCRPQETSDGRFKGGIRCPYHSWFYTLDGALKQTPHLEIEKDGLHLHRANLALWNGFIFINLDDSASAQEFDVSLQEIETRTARYGLAELVTGASITYSVDANWKVMLENYNECYHCAGVHPELCKIAPDFKRKGGSELDWDRGIEHAKGMDTFTFSGKSSRASFPRLDEDEQTRHKGELIMPNLMLSMAREHVAAFVVQPLAENKTKIICDFLFHPDEVAREDFDPSDVKEFWDLVNQQDWSICESVQRGMQSRKFNHGYYAPLEDLSLDIRLYMQRFFPA